MFALCPGALGTSSSAGGAWDFEPCEALADRSCPGSAVFRGEIYVVGGFRRGNNARSSAGSVGSVDVYSVSSRSWRQAPALGLRRGALALAALEDSTLRSSSSSSSCSGGQEVEGLYAVGGSASADPDAPPLDAVERLGCGGGGAGATASRAWRAESALPAGRSDLGLVACHGRLFALGGRCAAASSGASPSRPSAATNAVDIYDSIDRKWVPGPPMLAAGSVMRSPGGSGSAGRGADVAGGSLAVACCDGKVLAFVGGASSSSSSSAPPSSVAAGQSAGAAGVQVQVLDPAVGAWTLCCTSAPWSGGVAGRGSAVLLAAAAAGAGASAGRVLVLGGAPSAGAGGRAPTSMSAASGCRCDGATGVHLYNVAACKWESPASYFVLSHREMMCGAAVVRGKAFSDLPSALEFYRTRGFHYASIVFDRDFRELRYYGARRPVILKAFEAWWRQHLKHYPAPPAWDSVGRPVLALVAAEAPMRSKARGAGVAPSVAAAAAMARSDAMLTGHAQPQQQQQLPAHRGMQAPAFLEASCGSSGDEAEEPASGGLRRPKLEGSSSLQHPAARGTETSHVQYDVNMARRPGAIRADDCILCVKLASLAYTDDKPGTIEGLEQSKEALEYIAGGPARAALPLTELLRDFGFETDRIFSHTGILRDMQVVDTQGYIAHNDSDIVLAYRGSTNATDWLTNFGVGHVPFNPEQDKARGCAPIGTSWLLDQRAARLPKVHRGFYDSLLTSLWDIDEVLLPQLRDPKPKRLIICGHSLGGAVAMGALAYVTLKFDFGASPHRLLFVSCGQPRFGDARFKAMIEGEMHRLRHLDKSVEKATACRLVNDYDGVPRVPPASLGFKHAIRTVLLTLEGEVLIRPVDQKTAKRPNSEYVEDHRPLRYMQRLAKGASSAARRAQESAQAIAQGAGSVLQTAGGHVSAGIGRLKPQGQPGATDAPKNGVSCERQPLLRA
eukprot:TRINITY_DN21851_c0_g2_i3.p1 TRINITY_DN21851_c0_g2~~TRINITY_DN21851_c0_g2_i3.p1  ORF type:complete len:957 (+),score=224.80 TRINITY_DN21851_c0_g2_i3:74-2944(+)